jgi:Zn-finger nucleic acid-binding protein
MSEPYRDQQLICPACQAPLRAFQTRYICDACQGMMVPLADLGRAIHDMTSLDPTFEFKDDKPGKRTCPHCPQAMTRCKLRVVLDAEVEKPRPELDRCDAHGLWFDDEELAKVFEKVASKGFGGGVGRKGGGASGGAGINAKSGSYGWKGHHGVPEWWGGGGGGKW